MTRCFAGSQDPVADTKHWGSVQVIIQAPDFVLQTPCEARM